MNIILLADHAIAHFWNPGETLRPSLNLLKSAINNFKYRWPLYSYCPMEKWRENSKWRKRRNKLLKVVSLPNEGRVLDLSSGNGQFLELIRSAQPNLELFGIDISEEKIKEAKEEYPQTSFSIESVYSVNFPEKTFDVLFCNMSLHHFDEPIKMLKEARRVLKENGCLYIMDLFPKNRVSQIIYNILGCNDDYHFEKYYTLEEFKKIAISADLMISKSTLLTALPRLVALELKYQRFDFGTPLCYT